MPKGLFDPKEVVKKYVRNLERAGIHPEQILLYGSYARGTADRWSDLDFIVISKDFAKIPPIDRLEKLSLAVWGTGAPIEALGYSPQEIKERGHDSIIWETVQRNHKVLYKKAVH